MVPNPKVSLILCPAASRTILENPCKETNNHVETHEGHCEKCTAELDVKLKSVKKLQKVGWEYNPFNKRP